ncbi:Acidic elicitin A1 [Phytophthora cinnamomi]|uniref:Acidic elicitin A1 n=1 Tax=Phytophthora cinnamomi TaxID=4785 RepID=UPI00355A08D8|nr:Acidic elicitin A1 [Phytophthora cinnamomi]
MSTSSGSSSVASCSSTVLSALLSDQYITQCSTDSGYSFTDASIPTQSVIDLMCASSACRNLLADAKTMNLSECVLPVGDHILLLADLIDYVPARCPSSSGSATAGSSTTSSTVTAGSTAGNTTASSNNTVTVPSSSTTSTASSGETSTTTTTSASKETAASKSSTGSSAASPVGRAVGVLSIAAMSVVLALM